VCIYKETEGGSMPENNTLKLLKEDLSKLQTSVGYTDVEGKRKKLKNAVYFGGLYRGKDNGRLWDEVKKYIDTKIYMPCHIPK